MKRKLEVVFDTNIFISGIFFGGNPRACLELARESSIYLFISKAILLELSQKLYKKFKLDWIEIKDILEGIQKFTSVVTPKKKLEVIKKDPPDNRVLECALATKADHIVTGDKKHLLSLGEFENIPIVTTKEFLDGYYGKS